MSISDGIDWKESLLEDALEDSEEYSISDGESQKVFNSS